MRSLARRYVRPGELHVRPLPNMTVGFKTCARALSKEVTYSTTHIVSSVSQQG